MSGQTAKSSAFGELPLRTGKTGPEVCHNGVWWSVNVHRGEIVDWRYEVWSADDAVTVLSKTLFLPLVKAPKLPTGTVYGGAAAAPATQRATERAFNRSRHPITGVLRPLPDKGRLFPVLVLIEGMLVRFPSKPEPGDTI